MSTETVLRANVRELQEQVSRLQARLAEVIAERDAAVSALQSLSDDIYGLMGESYGVVGLHLNGFRLNTDVEVFRYPDRYMDKRGMLMWETAWEIVETLEATSNPQAGVQ